MRRTDFSLATNNVERPVLPPHLHEGVVPLQLLTVDEIVNGATPKADIPRRPSVEQQLQAAYQEGLVDGRAEGEAKARAELSDRISETMEVTALFGSLINGLQDKADEALRLKEADLASFAFEIAREILGYEPELTTKRLTVALREALSHIEPEIDLRIRVHPSQVTQLTDAMAETGFSSPQRYEVVGDGAIEPGGAVVEAGPTRIDTQIKSALERLSRVLADIDGVSS